MRSFSEAYGTGGTALSRMHVLEARFPIPERGNVLYFSVPGRAEIVGNHTDHNCGKVIVSSVSRDVLAAVLPAEGNEIEVVSQLGRPIRISLSDLSPRPEETGKSSALIRGVLAFLAKRGPLRGFRAYAMSTLQSGAGMSSSAAFSVLFAEIENVLAFGGALTPLDLAQAGQFAENVYFGKPCGLLDQCGVAFGGLNEIDFERPDAPEVRPLPPIRGTCAVLTHTGGSHSGLTAHYAAVAREMKDVARVFGKSVLREVKKEEFYGGIPLLRQRLSERAILRAIHFFEENERVERAALALRRGDKFSFYDQIRGSGESSYTLLQNCYVPGSAAQPLALALKLSEKLLKAGAARPMGGGFAGAVLAFTEEDETERYLDGMRRVFGERNVERLRFRPFGATQLG